MLLIGVSAVGLVYPQTSRSESLNKANQLYDEGKLTEAIDSAMMFTGDDNPESVRFQAYRLLSMAYLAKDEYRNARTWARKMLELNPTYNTSEYQDPFDFIRLLESIQVVPSFSVGLAATIGYNRTFPKVTSTFNGANYTKNYVSENGWQYGLVFGYTINRLISLHSGIIASSKRFGMNYQIDSWSFAAHERAIYLDFPLHARFHSKKIRGISGYADIGIFAGNLISYSSDFSRVSLKNGETFSMNNIDRRRGRNNWAYGSVFGAGINFKIKKYNFDITIDGRYYGTAFSNITREEQRLELGNLFYNFYYLDDDIRLNSFAISIAFLHHLNYRILQSK